MDLQNILNFQIPKGTVLFVDNACSIALSMMFKFEDLIPKKFTLICDLDNDLSKIQSLLERFISMIDFEHIALLISSPIIKYKKHIQTILEFEFDIFKIFTTVQNDDYSMLPKNISGDSGILQEINQTLIQITDHFSIIPSFPSILKNILSNSSESYSESVESASLAIENVFCQILKKSDINIRSYSYGDFSKRISEMLENGRKGDNAESAALLIDRNFCCTPLFTDNSSLLDKAASSNLSFVLQDINLIKEEIEDHLLSALAKILDVNEKPAFHTLSKKWKSLNPTDQFELSKKYPSIQYILDGNDNLVSQKILSAQDSLLNGADFDDIFACYCNSLKPNQLVKLIGFQNCIHRINFSDYLSDAISIDPSFSNDEDKFNYILQNCLSGLNLDLKQRSSYQLDELFFLPKLLNFIFDKNSVVNDEITAPSSGLMNLFKSSTPSLKSFKKIYIFVIGGVSFREIALIEKMNKSKNTNTDFHIISDTICSAIHLLE